RLWRCKAFNGDAVRASGGTGGDHLLDLVQPVQVHATVAVVHAEQAVGARVAVRVEELLDRGTLRQGAAQDAAVAHVQFHLELAVQFQLQGLEALDRLRVGVHARCDGNAVHRPSSIGSAYASREQVTAGS